MNTLNTIHEMADYKQSLKESLKEAKTTFEKFFQAIKEKYNKAFFSTFPTMHQYETSNGKQSHISIRFLSQKEKEERAPLVQYTENEEYIKCELKFKHYTVFYVHLEISPYGKYLIYNPVDYSNSMPNGMMRGLSNKIYGDANGLVTGFNNLLSNEQIQRWIFELYVNVAACNPDL